MGIKTSSASSGLKILDIIDDTVDTFKFFSEASFHQSLEFYLRIRF